MDKEKEKNSMNTELHCDIAIIGGGVGGLSVAAVASQLGLKVVLAEANKMGGDCLNTGCVPSKALIAAARSAHGFLTSSVFGIEPATPTIHFAKVMEHVAGVINTIAHHDSVERFTQLGVHVIEAKAKFIDVKTIEAGGVKIKARQFIIATGSSPTIPPIPGLDSVSYLTNESIFSLREKPSHLIIIGGGPIGCELAQAFSFLGIKVSLLEAYTIMPHDEPELVEILRNNLIYSGISLLEHCQVKKIVKTDVGIECEIQDKSSVKTINGSHLLIATGRSANVEDLNLDQANITYTKKGINVNDRLNTSNKRVYAIGDVTGGYQFTHIANYHAGIVIRNCIFKLWAKVDYSTLPWVTYTSPELAHTGLTEAEARKKFSDIRVLLLPFTSNDRAQTEHQTQGKIKIIVTSKGKILGCSILGEHAGELILPWIMLIKNKQSLRALTELIVPYPTLSEISKRIASEFYTPNLFSVTVKRLVNFLKYFG